MDSLWTRMAVRLGLGRPEGRRGRAAARVLPAVEVPELPVEPERPWGCGWFDSSLDLRLGLAVIECHDLPASIWRQKPAVQVDGPARP